MPPRHGPAPILPRAVLRRRGRPRRCRRARRPARARPTRRGPVGQGHRPHRHHGPAEPHARLGRARLRYGRRVPGPRGRRHRRLLEPGRPELPAPARSLARGQLQLLQDRARPRQRRLPRPGRGLRRAHLAHRHRPVRRRRPAQLPAGDLVRRPAQHPPLRRGWPARHERGRPQQRRLRRVRARYRPAPHAQPAVGLHGEPLDERLHAVAPAHGAARGPSDEAPAARLRPRLPAFGLELQPRRHVVACRAVEPRGGLQDGVLRRHEARQGAARLLGPARQPRGDHDERRVLRRGGSRTTSTSPPRARPARMACPPCRRARTSTRIPYSTPR